MPMHVLVTGGAGYIGSATVDELLDAGHRVTVFDDLSYGHRSAVDQRAAFVQASTADADALARVMAGGVDAVVHFAGFIVVGESMAEPDRYFQNNVGGSIGLLNAMVRYGVRRFVFSSTAAVFGDPEYVPLDEKHSLKPVNPYGESKLIVENMLRWYDERRGIKSVALRYFNASGATERRGEDHQPETHLIPNVLDVARGLRPHFPLFGTDYPTPDGTCIRDYVHIQDLAQAHVNALEYAETRSGRFNLGSGTGHSNSDVIQAARRVTGHPIPVESLPRRPGDPPRLVASPAMAKQELGWRPHVEDLDAIVASAWAWRCAHPNGYEDAGEPGKP